MDESTKAFLLEIDEFLQRTGMSDTAFSMDSLADPCFLRDVRKKGRSPTLRVVTSVREFMREYDAKIFESAQKVVRAYETKRKKERAA